MTNLDLIFLAMALILTSTSAARFAKAQSRLNEAQQQVNKAQFELNQTFLALHGFRKVNES